MGKVTHAGSVLALVLAMMSPMCHGQETSGVIITHYEVHLAPDFPANSMKASVECSIRNDGSKVLAWLDFDIFSREKTQGVSLTLSRVSRRIDRRESEQLFSRNALPSLEASAAKGAAEVPKVVRVNLSPPLAAGERLELRFEYAWQLTEAASAETQRFLSTMNCGNRTPGWLPEVMATPAEDFYRKLNGRLDPKVAKPTWTVSISLPPGYVGVVPNGRFVKAEQQGEETLFRWESRVPGFPQVAVGPFERIEVKRPKATVVFFLPAGSYTQASVEDVGDFLARAFSFYSELYGPLEDNQIHVAVGRQSNFFAESYLGMTMPLWAAKQVFQKGWDPMDPTVQALTHEVAHSWWGHSVTPYGRGSEFLRESLTYFSTSYLYEKLFGQNLFDEELAGLFWDGSYPQPMFYPERDDRRMTLRKGPLVLNILRSEMGEESFFHALRTFADRHQNGLTTFSDFVAVCHDASGRDWGEFIEAWCSKAGCPDYRLMDFESKGGDGKWETTVTIRNEGDLTISCPLELRTAEHLQREKFSVAPRSASTFKYETPAKVDEALIDADHNTYQGSGKERLLKVLAVQRPGPGIELWQAIAHTELGEYDKALKELSPYLDGAVSGTAPPSRYYSRAVTYFLKGNADSATKDFSDFIDASFAYHSRNRLIGDLSHAGITSSEERQARAQFHEILKRLTGQGFEYNPQSANGDEWDTTMQKWRAWWETNKSNFRLPETAHSLRPRGIAD